MEIASARKVAHDPLVEALEARREQGQLLLRSELLDDLLCELTTRGVSATTRWSGCTTVDRVECRGDDVDAQDHLCPAAVRLVVDLTGTQRSRIAVVEEPQSSSVPRTAASGRCSVIQVNACGVVKTSICTEG